ncbi:outer membrane protein with beta-barrel domain [Neolewinella xylanilytica]|uniref:Outer membrane protein with beta-barrel domain n=1 Tax=Neolewinella xylanilytica TaxID=1514080 RepID=A0A2S6HZU4_9BACT|nr:porin family protein [Neolewinella xylanilytica]PPK84036.1 outer membrane protein with beta-barrel domain [Neolewinella xylanilytica]
MHRSHLPLLLALMLPLSGLYAQTFSGGFRAGLNFITFDADEEMDGDMTLEEFRRTTGFHVGATFALAFTDLVGVKADLMYSQKGGEVRYQGPSYFYVYGDVNDVEGLRINGDLDSERDVLNSYIDIPVVGYYRLGPVEIEGGVSAGFLVNSRASGSATFSNVTFPDGRTVDDISFNYDYNYFSDDIGFAAIIEPSPTRQGFPSVIDAYYNSEDNRPLYRRLDFGLVGGASVFLNNGLYLGLRYQYGLTDATRGENDLRLARTEGVEEREYNTNDKDYNRVIQTSIGFRF